MRKSLIMIAAALFIFAGCQKEASVMESTSNNVIHIGVKQLAPPTKVAADDISAQVVTFHWEEGDEVAFFPTDDDKNITIFKCVNASTKEFTKQSGSELDPTKNYGFYYPANFYDGEIYHDSAYHEVYRSNQIPKEHFIYGLGQGSSDEFTLNNHNNLLHLALKGNVTIGKIEYHFGYGSNPSAVLDCGIEGVQLNTGTPTNFYIDIQNYPSTNSFSFVFKDIQGNTIQTTLSSFALSEYKERWNNIIDFPELEVVKMTN